MSEWRDMGNAPRDRSACLLLFKRRIAADQDATIRWAGLMFVGRHEGFTPSGLDLGWGFAAPIGMGGFPDEWLAGWQPLPSPPENENG